MMQILQGFEFIVCYRAMNSGKRQKCLWLSLSLKRKVCYSQICYVNSIMTTNFWDFYDKHINWHNWRVIFFTSNRPWHICNAKLKNGKKEEKKRARAFHPKFHFQKSFLHLLRINYEIIYLLAYIFMTSCDVLHARPKAKLNKWRKVDLIKEKNLSKEEMLHFILQLLIMQISFPTLNCKFVVVKCVHKLKSHEFLFLDSKNIRQREDFFSTRNIWEEKKHFN
jgi:hypothetical protein